jgi:flagellar biosynthetic protein FlhB
VSDKPDKHEKTEKPTPQRKKKARQDGQIAKSPDVAQWVLLLAATYFIPQTISAEYEALQGVMRQFQDIAMQPDAAKAAEILGTGLANALTALIPMLAYSCVLGMVVTMAQVGFVFSGKSLKPKGERLNPFAGLKRMVSMKALWESFKSTAKFGVVAAAAIPSTIAVARDLISGEKMETVTVLSYVAESALSMVRMIAWIALIIAFADYIYQRRSISKSLMMTKAEMKQEMRNSDGDPMVKGRMRSLQRALSSNRMMAEVGDANVVIMNPTHFAVALRYRPNEGAPRVVAKGRDAVALRIRDKAQEASVPVVEAPPLARAIFKACELEQEIPHRLFTAVAKVLAFVHRLQGRSSLSGVFVLPDIQVDEE